MAGTERPTARELRRGLTIAVVSYCAAFTAMSAANDVAHALLGWELASIPYRYIFPLVLCLAMTGWARLMGTTATSV